MTASTTTDTAALDVEEVLERLPLAFTDTPDYAEMRDKDGKLIALTTEPRFFEALSEAASLIRQLRGERDHANSQFDAHDELLHQVLGERDAFKSRAESAEASKRRLEIICDAAEAEVSRLRARVEAMEKALEPFAKAADAYHSHDGQHDFPDDHILDVGAFNRPTVGDLRTARAVKEAE
ncbi:hypothetical protein [Nitratireductor sp. GCM10026969]|uniref:hypothetical protein n=1 Tax=Nitratireductor sp. GCM10026969 TaxID=3252645 RepID=UPI00361C9ABD